MVPRPPDHLIARVLPTELQRRHHRMVQTFRIEQAGVQQIYLKIMVNGRSNLLHTDYSKQKA
jgi:hypothetical protein